MAKRKYNGPLGYHPGQPDTVVTGGDTMHCVPFDMMGRGAHRSLNLALSWGALASRGSYHDTDTTNTSPLWKGTAIP